MPQRLHAWPLLTALALLAPSPARTAVAEPLPSPDVWLSTFYRQPRPDQLAGMIARLDRDGVLERDAARAPLVGFLSVVFRRADVQAERVVATARVGSGGRAVLLDALWLSGRGAAAARLAGTKGTEAERYRGAPPDLGKMVLRDPAALDMMWGAFLASGDVAWPRRLIDLLDTPEPFRPPSPGWVALSGAAEWSLLSNSRQHERVAVLVRDEATRRTGPAREALERIVRELGPPVPVPAPGSRMTRIVSRDVGPGVPKGSFAGLPKTLYRVGDQFGRVEEEPDPPRGLHLLVIVAEPHAWQINLAEGTGRHFIDPGPSLIFHAPILPAIDGQPRPPMLELGNEREFMASHGASKRPGTLGGKPVEILEVTVDDNAITLWLRKETGLPCRIKVERAGAVVTELEYLDYQQDLPVKPGLFAPPPNIRVEEGS